MNHVMKLWNDSFESIKNKSKTIEMRLNDEKRSIIKEDDTIEFINTSTKEKLIVKVIKLHKYDSFEELYKNHDKVTIGYEKNEVANPNDMLHYYTIDNIKKYGVMGIEIKVLD